MDSPYQTPAEPAKPYAEINSAAFTAGHLEGGFDGDPTGFYEGANKLSLAVQLGGIMIIIMTVFMILYFAFIFLIIGIGAASATTSGTF